MDVLNRFSCQPRQHIDDIVMLDHAIVFDDRFHIPGMMKAMVVVKTTMNRPVGDCRSNWRRLVVLLRVPLARVGIEVLEIEMPLANRRGVVPLPFQETRDRGAISGNQARRKTLHHSFLQSRSPAISPGHYAVSRGRTDRRTGMNIREYHSLGCESVGVGSWDLAGFRSQAMNVPIPKIVADDVDDIRLLSGRGGWKRAAKQTVR